MKVVLCVLGVVVIVHLGAFLAYGVAGAAGWVKQPEPANMRAFMLGVLVDKTGHAIAFVLLFLLARDGLDGRWMLYAAAWWPLFVLGEVGTAMRPGYSWPEAGAGIAAETMYLPAAALFTQWMLGR